MAVQSGEDVYATLLLSDTYLPGALVLAHSLRDAGTIKKLAVLVTVDTVSAEVITQLKSVFDFVLPVDRIKNATPANLYLMDRADLHSTFTKINLWKQTQFSKIVYLDADVVAYRAPDELFNLAWPFSAAPDIGWPDLFNSGVMALTPNLGDYYALTAMAERGISFDGADQGLLNMHFKNTYNRLSFTYNVTPSSHYQYLPAYRHFQSGINMVHFIGSEKPWFQGRSASTGGGSPYDEMVGRWWAVYDRHYRKPSPANGPQDQSHQVPEIVQYFVKGEYQPTTTYRVPTGQPSFQGSSSHDTQYQASPALHSYPHQSHGHHESHGQFHHYSDQEHRHDEPEHHYHPNPTPNESLNTVDVEGTQAEAREDQVRGHPEKAQKEPERKRQPPSMEPSWDAQRQPPPSSSKPEAFNFPQTRYEMSSDVAPFVPPTRYPSPPRNMWYEVPKNKPAPASEKPRPVFPWEVHQPRASRVFANDNTQTETSEIEEPITVPSGEPRSSADSGATTTELHLTEPSTDQKSEPSTPTIHVTPSDPWAAFTRSNAWDDVPGIEKYVDNLPWHRRNKSQDSPAGQKSPGSAAGSGQSQQQETTAAATWRRRGSKLTDFPTAVERPSLPVTPAPIRRPKFWGGGGPGIGDDDDEDDEKLPAAKGVPRQSEWDPVARLQLLAKQQSEMLLQRLGPGADGSTGIETRDIPSRPLPFGSEDIVSPTYAAQASHVLSPQPVKPGARPRSILGEDKESNTGSSSTIQEPSYHGPGVAWEKDEGYADHSTVLPPSEEEKDVLET